jgi:hypothetical protein
MGFATVMFYMAIKICVVFKLAKERELNEFIRTDKLDDKWRLVFLEVLICFIHLMCCVTWNDTECFRKSFTSFKAYINLFRGHVQYSKMS